MSGQGYNGLTWCARVGLPGRALGTPAPAARADVFEQDRKRQEAPL